MVIQVWHTTDENFRAGICGEDVPFPSGYRHVANVDATGLDHAYQLTNTIDGPWWENEEVEFLHLGGARSSSVGDVFVKNGWAYRVESVGFKELGHA